MRKKNEGNGIGHITPDGYHTRATAAEMTGRSVDTLKRWHKTGLFKPSHVMNVGKLTVWLYSDSDIEAMRDIAAHQQPGRKKKHPLKKSA